MSGFSYPEWIGEFYPKGTKREQMLSHYATRFRAVEINMTFRRRLESSTATKWREAVDDGFRFILKANAGITHYFRLVGVGDRVREFVERADALGACLGPILFQTPEILSYDTKVFDEFCAELPQGKLFALEPRHDSFFSDDALATLERNNIALCLNDDVFDLDRYRATGPFAYFRFHREKPYAKDELEQRAELLRQIANEGRDVYAFLSHEDNPESIRPALELNELVTAE